MVNNLQAPRKGSDGPFRPPARGAPMTRILCVANLIALSLALSAVPGFAQDARAETAKKEGKVVWYTSLALPSAERVAADSSAGHAGATGQYQERRRHPHLGCRPLRPAQGEEAAREVHAGVGGRVSAGLQGQGRLLLRPARHRERDRVQPEDCAGGGGTEDLEGSAGPEVEGQAGDGAPRLQR